MKKILATFTILCYLLLTTGVVVNFHYCMNQLASVKFFEKERNKCSLCGMKMHRSHGCCHDEICVVKLSVDQQKVVPVDHIEAPTGNSFIISDFIVLPTINTYNSNPWQNHSPPLLTKQDTYLENCVFRI
ncbi:MAG TPA: hypothetical protein VLJ68_11250 [Chitinophagaceae bacterium]|nr:hypothetical protein [Chitinophagaceae bacterium]